MKIIKILLASSSELKDDREQFEIFINRKNKEYIKKDIFLELVIWEDFLDAMSATGLRNEYNKAITDCDVFVSLFKTKVGQYTEEEFTQAFKTFKINNRPLIYTYFQDSQINVNQVNIEDLTSLKNFKDKLSQLGHDYTIYKNIDDLKHRFSEQLNKFLPKLADNLRLIPISNRSQPDEIAKLRQELEDPERSHQSKIGKKDSEITRLQNTAKSQQENNEQLTKKLEEAESNRFKVALSFPGEHRDFVLKVAEELATRLTRDQVFYDEWYETELLGVGGDLKLQSMYQQADLVVPFFSEYYSKSWCSLEWETIRGILLNRRQEDAVIPVHLDDTVIPGWSAVNFGIRLRGRTPQQISDLILEALAIRNPQNASQQKQIEELTKKLEEIQRSHKQQLEERERSYQSKIRKKDAEITRLLEEKEKLKQSLQSQIRQLEQQLAQERSRFTKQQTNLQAAQEKIEPIIAQLQEQIKQLKSDPKTTAKDKVELKSEKGVDYTQLRDLLAAGKWQEADEETANVMLEVAERKSEVWLRESDIDNFPCEDLRTINQLWLHYSNGKFGFSVQKEIYDSLGGTREYNSLVWNSFGDRVGWKTEENGLDYDELTFNLDEAPTAHLPLLGLLLVVGMFQWNRGYSSLTPQRIEVGLLFSRAKTCKL